MMNKTMMWLIIGVITAAMGVLLAGQHFMRGGDGPSEIIMRPSPRPDFSMAAPPPMAPQTAMPDFGRGSGAPSGQGAGAVSATAGESRQLPAEGPGGRISSGPSAPVDGASGRIAAAAPAKDRGESARAPAEHPAAPAPSGAVSPVPVKSITDPEPEDIPGLVPSGMASPGDGARHAAPAPSSVAPAPAKPVVAPAPKPAAPAPAKPAAPAKAAGEKTVKAQTSVGDGGFVLRLTGSEALRYQSILLKSPDRLVVDLPGKWEIKAPGVPKNAIATNVRIGLQTDKTRVVIDLSSAPGSHRIVAVNPNTLEIRVKK